MNQDKLTLALARGLEARQQLAEAEGGSLSSEEAARLLGISKTAVLKRLEAGRLLAARFPRWQFDDRGRVLVGLEEVLAILNQDERLDAWGQILFFFAGERQFRLPAALGLAAPRQTESCLPSCRRVCRVIPITRQRVRAPSGTKLCP